MKTGEMKRTQ